MYNEFTDWLNAILEKELPFDAVAINFNLYEDSNLQWSIQLIATERFDREDDEWACDEVYTSGEDLYTWKQDTGWREILDLATGWINKYLEEGKYASELKKYTAVGVGFVDGDISVLYEKE